MGRVIKEVVLGGKIVNALFDTGSERSYVATGALPAGTRYHILRPSTHVGLGGREYELKKACLIMPEVEDMPFDLKAYPVDSLGQEGGKEIGLIVGATAMEEWDMMVDPKKTIDLTGVRTREFTEF